MTWEFTEELENEIIEALQNGIGLNAWCKGDNRPSRSTVLRLMDAKPEFESKCARAREWAGDLAAEEHNEVMKGCLSGEIPPDVAGRVLSGMQWRASKLAHKRYGDSTTLRGDKENPVAVASIQIIDNVPKD